MSIKKAKNILIAPLDWGLGHTTRCVPIISYLQQLGHNVLFAGNEQQKAYISATVPSITTIHLDGYNVRYSNSPHLFALTLLRQLPSLKRSIKKENSWLQQVVQDYNIDAVISDNRYGLYHTTIPCVILTHQLQILSGKGVLFDNVLRQIHYRYLEKFSSCWVVDVAQQPNLAGKMAHPTQMPKRVQYIGWLSQTVRDDDAVGKHLLIILSGPEPQRTILSNILWKEAISYNGKVVFVAGNSHADKPAIIPPHITYHPILSKDELATAFNNAELVVCRSGYSTVMDLVKLNKKAILIPTPAQTEQEYLAKQLHKQGIFMRSTQNRFNLKAMLQASSSFPYKSLNTDEAFLQHRAIIDSWIAEI